MYGMIGVRQSNRVKMRYFNFILGFRNGIWVFLPTIGAPFAIYITAHGGRGLHALFTIMYGRKLGLIFIHSSYIAIRISGGLSVKVFFGVFVRYIGASIVQAIMKFVIGYHIVGHFCTALIRLFNRYVSSYRGVRVIIIYT